MLSAVSTLRAHVTRLGVKTPPIDSQNQWNWVRWLVYMTPLAETGDIRTAREWKNGDPLPDVTRSRY